MYECYDAGDGRLVRVGETNGIPNVDPAKAAAALAFHRAVNAGDDATEDRLLKDFFVPYVRIRNRGAGYAVSIVKAGAAIVGRSAGKVRPPLSDCTAEEVAELRELIERMGPQD